MSLLTDEQLQHAYRYAMTLCDEHANAMDIVHTAYLRLLKQETGHIQNILAYFLRCVRNTFIDQKRSDNRLEEILDQQESKALDIGVQTLETMVVEQDLIQKIWSELKPLERELLYLWAVEGYTIDEIASLTQTVRGTLLSRVHRVRKKIADQEIDSEVVYDYTRQIPKKDKA